MPDELELLIQQIKNDVGEERFNLLYKSRFEKIRKIYDTIKQKSDNAQWAYNMTSASDPDVDPFDLFVLKGQIEAYNDVLSLLESAGISPTIDFNKKDE